MPIFNPERISRAFIQTLLSTTFPSPDGQELVLEPNDGYKQARETLLSSPDIYYPHYVLTIIQKLLSLDTHADETLDTHADETSYILRVLERARRSATAGPDLIELFLAIDFNKLAGKALEAQPYLEAKLRVFFLIMGLFYDRDLIQLDQADEVIKCAAASLNKSLLGILAKELVGDVRQSNYFYSLFDIATNPRAVKAFLLGDTATLRKIRVNELAQEPNDLYSVMVTWPSVIGDYYSETIDSSFNADRMVRIIELTEGTLLYQAMLVSLLAADYNKHWSLKDAAGDPPMPSLLINSTGNENLQPLRRYNYKAALLAVAELPALKNFFRGQTFDGELFDEKQFLDYLKIAVFQGSLSELYDFLEGVISKSLIDELEKDHPVALIKATLIAERQAAAEAAAQEQMLQRVLKDALDKAESRFNEKLEAMFAKLEARLANLEQQVLSRAESPRAAVFFRPSSPRNVATSDKDEHGDINGAPAGP